MNTELFNKMVEKKNDLYAIDQKLREEFGKATSNAKKLTIKEQVEECDRQFYAVKADIDNYVKATNTLNENALAKYEDELGARYGYIINRETPVQEVKSVKTPKKDHSSTIAAILAGAVILTGGILIGKYAECPFKKDNKADKTIVNPTDNKDADVYDAEENVVFVKPFDTYGEFTDVNNEDQLRARATWYYNTYIANHTLNSNEKASLTIENIMNDIRMINGEFREENGEAKYNDTYVLEVSDDIYTVSNMNSYSKYGNDIKYTAYAPLFVDGSLAQKAAIHLDEKIAKVITAIRANDNEAFVAAAKDWGTSVLYMYHYIDFNSDYINIHQTNAPTSFFEFATMYGPYTTTILEYSQRNHLDICIPYCTDYNTGVWNEIALSDLMYNISEVPMDAVAVRSGHQEEYAANNLSLPEDLFVKAKDYFNSKYSLEIGQSRKLK